jgi:hypothetical protein
MEIYVALPFDGIVRYEIGWCDEMSGIGPQICCPLHSMDWGYGSLGRGGGHL